jgi:dTMP kinase
MFNAKGRFFVVEGIDGSGKSTLARALAAYAKALVAEVVLTKEPGATDLGKVVRGLVQESKSIIDPYAEFLLFAADRAQHMTQVIKPILDRGGVVITDRFKYSSLAYQGYGRGLDKDFIESVNNRVTHYIEPHIIFYCKIDPQMALSRCISRNEKQTRFEAEGASFMRKVADGFDTIFKNNSQVVIIDASKSQEEMFDQARNVLMGSLEL